MDDDRRTVSTDDRIHGVRGRFYEAHGDTLPVAFHYDVLFVFVTVSVITGLLSLIGGATPKNTITYALVLGILTAAWVSKQLDRDRGLLGLLMIIRAELRTWWVARLAAVQHRNDIAPRHITLRKVRR